MSSIADVVAHLRMVLETSIAIGKHVQAASDLVDDAVLILRNTLAGTNDAESEQLIALFADVQDELAHQAAIVGATSATVAAMIDRLVGDTTPSPATDSTSIPHPSTTDQHKHQWIARDAGWAARRVAELPTYEKRTTRWSTTATAPNIAWSAVATNTRHAPNSPSATLLTSHRRAPKAGTP